MMPSLCHVAQLWPRHCVAKQSSGGGGAGGSRGCVHGFWAARISTKSFQGCSMSCMYGSRTSEGCTKMRFWGTPDTSESASWSVQAS